MKKSKVEGMKRNLWLCEPNSAKCFRCAIMLCFDIKLLDKSELIMLKGEMTGQWEMGQRFPES